MQKIKIEAENDLEKRCKNLKEQNEALISGLNLANETISNLYGLLREYRQQKEKLLKQNTKLLAIYTVIIIAHIITAIINQSYRNSLMFYFLSVVSIVYGIDLCSQNSKKVIEMNILIKKLNDCQLTNQEIKYVIGRLTCATNFDKELHLKAIKKLEIQRKYLEEGNVEIKEDGDK